MLKVKLRKLMKEHLKTRVKRQHHILRGRHQTTWAHARQART